MHDCYEYYWIQWHACEACNCTGRSDPRNYGTKGALGDTHVGYIRDGAHVPTAREFLSGRGR